MIVHVFAQHRYEECPVLACGRTADGNHFRIGIPRAKRCRLTARFVACLAAAGFALVTGGSSFAAVSPAADDGVQLPLDTDRRIEFVTDEATWMSPDLSPDGETILFDVLGDIYAVDAAGGEARPVLRGLPYETQPVFSPDGERFAFLSDRSGTLNLWIADADGGNLKRLSRDDGRMTLYTSPAWSPDGQYVFVSRAVHSVLAFEIWMFHVRGGQGIPITDARPAGHESFDERHNALGAAPSPDGRYLYYAVKTGTTWSEQELPEWSIVRRDLRTGKQETVIDVPGGAMRPALSHDGGTLVYASRYRGRTGLRLRDLGTGSDRWLTFPIDRDGQEGGYYSGLVPRVSFAPDDEALLTSVGGRIRRLDADDGTHEVVPVSVPVELDAGPDLRVDIPVETGPVRARIIQAPRLSPDGRSIVFSALGGLYLMELSEDAAPRHLARAGRSVYQPAWSPDGRRIAYVSWTAEDGGHVWEMDVAGSREPRRLTGAPAFYTEPSFSADGDSIVALRASHDDRLRKPNEISTARATDIVLLADGEASLVRHAFGAEAPRFAANGERIRFLAPEGLSSIRVDGSDLRREIQVVGRHPSAYVEAPRPAAAVRVNAAGDWALVKAASQLYLVAVPPANGESPPVINLSSPTVARRRLTEVGADYIGWADGGRTITWSVGSTFRMIDFDDLPFEGERVAEDLAESYEAVVEVERDVPRGTLVLRGGTAITMRGEEVLANADIVIEDNRIAAIGPAGEVAVPPAADVRDISGQYVLPGFVDTHAHWVQIRREVLDIGHWNFLVNLAYGVTAGLDVQPFTVDIFSYQDMIDAGLMPGPRAFSTGPGVFVDSEIHDAEDAVNVLTRYRDHYRTRNIKAYMVGNRSARQHVVNASRELGMMPTTEGASDFRLNLTHAIDGFAGNEHTLPVTPLHKDVIQLFARTRIGYTPTLSVLYGGAIALDDFVIRKEPWEDPKLCRFVPPGFIAKRSRGRTFVPPFDRSYPLFAADALRIQRAGGLVGIGSHGNMQGIGYHWEMQAYASGGATPQEVLRAATIDAAGIIGREQDLGSLEPGKLADLLILDENPLDDIANTLSIELVMKNGRLYDADTLDEIWPRRRPLPPQWFHHLAPESADTCTFPR